MVLRDLEPFLLATFHSPFLFPDFTTLLIWGLPRELPESLFFPSRIERMGELLEFKIFASFAYSSNSR